MTAFPTIRRGLALLFLVICPSALLAKDSPSTQVDTAIAAYEADPGKGNLLKLVKVHDLARDALGEADDASIRARNFLVFAYADHNEISKAVGSISRVGLRELPVAARSLYRKRLGALGTLHPLTIQAKTYIAYGLLRSGAYTEAIALSKEAAAEAEAAFKGPSHAALMANLVITNVYSALGRDDDALQYAKKGTLAAASLVGKDHPTYAEALMNYGNGLSASGRKAEALDQYKLGLEIFRKHYGESSRSTSVAYANTAAVLSATGNREAAVIHAEKSLAIARTVLGESHPDTLGILGVLAGVHVLGRDFERAVLVANEMLDVAEKVADRRYRLQGLTFLGGAHLGGGKFDQAIPVLERAVAEIEKLRTDLRHSTEEQSGAFSEYSGVHKLLAIAYLGKKNIDASFRVAEAAKARSLLEETSFRIAEGGGIISIEEKSQIEAMESSIKELDSRISYNKSAGRDVATHEVAKDRLTARLSNYRSDLAVKYPRYRQLVTLGTHAVDAGKQALPANTIFVNFLVLNSELAFAYVVDSRNNKVFVARQKDPKLSVSKVVALYRDAIANVVSPRTDGLKLWKSAIGGYEIAVQSPSFLHREVSALPQIEEFIGDQLLGPVKSLLVKADRVIISPDDVLTTMPFEALRVDGERLIDRYDISYVHSLTMYGLLKQRQSSRRDGSSKDYLGVGGVTYAEGPSGASEKRAAKALIPAFIESVANTRNLAALANDPEPKPVKHNVIWIDLPNTKEEIINTSGLFPVDKSKTMFGNIASEKNFRQMSDSGELKTYKYLHFATHGYLSESNPTASAIVLSQVVRDRGFDGYLTAAELAGYNLNSDLVVLSACETGLGKFKSGEGVMGLPFALYAAGNINTVMTLWQIEDESASAFVTALFKNLKAGEEISAAVNKTKREFLKNPGWTDAYFWAPFVFYGI